MAFKSSQSSPCSKPGQLLRICCDARGQQMAAEADQPEIATSDTTGAETETLVCWQGDSVMSMSRVSDSPILMYRGFEIGMAQSISPLAPPAHARCRGVNHC